MPSSPLVAFFSILLPNQFPTAFNIRSMGISASVIALLAIGQTYVIIGGGIDLSVGSVLVFSGVAAAKLMATVGPSAPLGTCSRRGSTSQSIVMHAFPRQPLDAAVETSLLSNSTIDCGGRAVNAGEEIEGQRRTRIGGRACSSPAGGSANRYAASGRAFSPS